MYSIIATWYVTDGKLAEALAALRALAETVRAQEPDTWAYLVHSGGPDSLPPSAPETIVFVEIYKDEQAFQAHVAGAAFTGFLKRHGNLFVGVPPGNNAFFQVQHIERIEGFVRPAAAGRE